MKNNENKNKGFTLVELIVVLVILGILAAMLIPGLLGYIDRAKGSQVVLNAKTCLTAAQAEASTAYASATSADSLKDKIGSTEKKRIMTTADVPTTAKLWIAPKNNAAGLEHDKWTVGYVYYAEGTSGEYFNGSAWIDDSTGECPAAPAGTAWIQIQ